MEQIGDQLRSELTRACQFITSINKDERNDDWHDLRCGREDDYSLSLVETLWEFPSSSPIQDTWEIGAKLMNLFKEGGKVSTIEVPDMSAKEGSEEPAEAERILNSPCFSIPIAEGVRLKLYAKTNKRIRFEIVQTELWKHRKSLLEEAGIQPKTDEQPWGEIPHLLKALRGRAAKHMNHLMEHLRKDQRHEVQPRSLIHLLSEIAAAAQPTYFTQNRQDSIQTLLIWLCYYGGYRGSTKNGPYSHSLTILESRGVIKFDPSRKFYVLCEAYKAAAAALVSTTGEPLLAFFGVENGFRWSQESKMPIRLRE